MNKEFEDFLKYGITETISKKQLIEGKFLLLFFSLLTVVISQFSIIICTISALNFILGCVLTYSKQEVTGKKIFWIQGVESVNFTLAFALIGTCATMYVIEEKYHIIFMIFLLIAYLMVIALYVGMIVRLIKKGAYGKTHKVKGSAFFMIFAAGGMAVARIFKDKMSNTDALQLIGICSYFISFVFLIGIFGFVKYYYLKKLEL